MVPNPTPATIIVLIFGVSTFILIMLLPAFFELKRPKDAGPRRMMDNIVALHQLQLGQITSLINVEEESGLDQAVIKKITDIISFLPNLEAG